MIRRFLVTFAPLHLVIAVALALLIPFAALAQAAPTPASSSPIVQLLIQNLWIVVMLAALYAASPALNKLADYLTAKAAAAGPGPAKTALDLAAVLAHCAANGVVQVESELRPSIKEVGADGKITPEEAAKLRAEAIARAADYAKACFGDLLGGKTMDTLGAMLAPHVDTQAALLAGHSRAALDAHGDTRPGAVPPTPAAA